MAAHPPASASPTPERGSARGDAVPSSETVHRMLESAILAPSAENKHYLRFETTPDGIRLLSTDTSTWNEQPHRKVLALVSYGAVMENLSLAAGALGYALTTRWLPHADRPELIAQCRWSADPPVQDTLHQAITQRHTNRRFYRRTPAAAASLQRVGEAARMVAGTRLSWLDERGDRAAALQALRIAETERFRRQALHRELFSAIRFEIGWTGTANEGLPPAALEVEPAARLAFASLSRWPLMKALVPLGVHHALGLRAADLPCRLAPHVGLICCDLSDVSLAALRTGRALQRAWLAATAEGLAFQPMAASLALTHQRPGDGWVSRGAQEAIARRLRRWTDSPAPVALFFRMGHAPAPSAVTARPPVESFLARPSPPL